MATWFLLAVIRFWGIRFQSVSKKQWYLYLRSVSKKNIFGGCKNAKQTVIWFTYITEFSSSLMCFLILKSDYMLTTSNGQVHFPSQECFKIAGIIAERSRASFSWFLFCGRGLEFESRPGTFFFWQRYFFLLN